MAGASELFRIASDVLMGRPVEPAAEAAARRLMARLGVGDPAALLSGEEPANMPAILAAASRMAAVFGLALPDAPGLAFVGGAADPRLVGISAGDDDVASLAGAASAPGRAFAAAIAEGIEYLSQFRRPGDPVRSAREAGPPAGGAAAAPIWSALLGLDDTAGLIDIEVTPALRLGDGAPALLPAALVYREPGGPRVPILLGNGCSAGETATRATLKAVLETVERDAAALWWSGQRPARLLAAETLAATGATKTLAAMRNGVMTRRTLFLDIGSEIDLPVVAAVSFGDEGRGFAGGYAADPDPARALGAALVELAQMELGQHLARLKRSERGDAALSAADRMQLRRAEEVTFADLPIEGVGNLSTTLAAEDDEICLAAAVEALRAAGFSAYAVDLTRAEFGIPVARVITVGLQPQPASVAVGRLGRGSGAGGLPQSRGIDLF